MRNLLDFTGKKILVTGASSGIGQSTAISLAEQGAQVVLLGRSRERLEETEARMLGTKHQIVISDLSEVEDMTALFDEVMSDGKKLNGLVHCAGVATVLPINMINRRKVDECMSVNLYALLEMTRLYAKKKYHEGGAIVAVSSIVVKHPSKCQTVYAASKGAVNAAVQALAIELADKKIRINCVMPGNVDTGMMRSAKEHMSEDMLKKKLEEQLLGLTQPEEIANTIMFLLSDLSSAVTGRAFCADGGMIG